MRWENGRQGVDYQKLKLFESECFKFDVHLLRFKPNAYIIGHKDEVPEGYFHRRLNIILKQNKSSRFWLAMENGIGVIHQHKKRVMLFNPSEITHGMTGGWKQDGKTGYWLSIGWLCKRKSQNV